MGEQEEECNCSLITSMSKQAVIFLVSVASSAWNNLPPEVLPERLVHLQDRGTEFVGIG